VTGCSGWRLTSTSFGAECELRRRNDGRNNAFGRDLMAVQDFIDRHVWNYNQNDPYVNYSNDTTKLGHVGRFGLMQASTVPGVDEIVTR
jgi:hypothetical protein